MLQLSARSEVFGQTRRDSMTNERLERGLSFGERKEAYQKFRLTYPDELFQDIVEGMPTERRSLAIDLGCGTGHSTSPLLSLFERVVAVEPDARMADQIEPAPNLEVISAKSEEMEFSDDVADLITSGTAFYWMDGPVVLDNMRQWLRTDGLVAVYRYALPQAPPTILTLLEREFCHNWDQFRNERLLDEDYSWRIIRQSDTFKNREKRAVSNKHVMNAHSLIGFFSSTSYVGAYLRTLDDPDGYLDQLEREVVSAMGEESFQVDFGIELILASSPRR